jgi:putative membrane protein
VSAAADPLRSGAWHRLHPLSPVVRAGRGLAALVIVVAPALIGKHDVWGPAVQLGIVGVLAVVGLVSWLVTRWRLEEDTLRIETGLVRRRSLRFPLRQIQAIDIVRPGLARLFGLAELRLRMGGTTGGQARLAYLPSGQADALRARLLDLAHGHAPAAETPPPADEHVLLTVPPERLVASMLISRMGLVVEGLVVALVVGAVVSPDVAGAVIASSIAVILGVATAFWRRFNDEYRLTVADAPDGLRLRAGLVALTSETIRPGRVQAVRMVEPVLWRPLGWCRLEVDLAGKQRQKGESRAAARPVRAVLPVGSHALALELLARILPDAPVDRVPPPRRARLKSPLRYRHLSWALTETCAVATTGRLARTTVWVPLAKVQSLRRVEGPLQRRLRLATVHLDTAGRNVHAALRDRDAGEADRALSDLVRLCRAARAAA